MSDKVSNPPAESEPRVVVCLFDFCKWILQRVNRFPKNWRATLGDRLEFCALDALIIARRAAVSKEKTPLLNDLIEQLEILRTLLRLARDLECLQPRQYEHAANQLDEIGRQVGGWKRYLIQKAP